MKEIIAEQVDVEHPDWYRALSLRERLATLQKWSPPQAIEQHNRSAQQKLQRWQQIDAFQKGGNFSERLAADGLTEDDFLVLLGESAAAIQQRTPVPDWLNQLAEIVEHTTVPSPGDMPQTQGTQDAEHSRLTLLNTVDLFVQYGKDRLSKEAARLAVQYDYLPFDLANVATLFLPNLATSLYIANRTMVLELNVARLQERLSGSTSEERFQDFVQQTRQKSNLLPLLQEYPVLARLLVNGVNRWLNYSLEFLTHLCADWSEILATFFPQRAPGLLVTAESGAGDVHRGGRSVFTLTFASGQKLVYKPKSLAVDVHFQELLLWLNARGDHAPFRTLVLLDRDSYGWSEFVEAHSCSNEDEIVRFYERQGAYLALLYALDATDFHFENLIAAGDQPILIDLEALFHARVSTDVVPQSDVAFDCVNYSVMRIGLLPNRIFSNLPGHSLDISGLGGHEGQQTPIPVMNWEDSDTDRMHMQRQYRTLPGKNNRPKLGQNVVDPLMYRDAVATGFTRMYRLLMTNQEALCAGPLEQFAHDEVRCIIRATNLYAHLLSESFHPDLLSDALDRDRHFDHLWITTRYNDTLARIIPWEHADLLDGDIPMFTGYPASCDLYSSHQECIADFFDQSSLQVTKKTVRALDEQDMERQLWFVHASFTSMLMGKGAPSWKRPSVSVPSGKAVTRERLLAAACAIGDRLCALALGDEKGVNWVGLTLVEERQWLLASANPDLYSGNAGIILFLSYLGMITGEARYTDMVEAAYITMRKQVERMQEQLKSIGIYDGWGSIIYALTHLGVLWNDPTLLLEAEKFVEHLPELIEQDTVFDLLSGSVGCILSLLALHQVTQSPAVLDAAILCGDHLLATAQPQEQGVGWLNPAISHRPLTGFSHGAASYALSLFALAKASGQQRFSDLARQAMTYERSVFSAQAQNWPDYRIDDELEDAASEDEKYMVAWCHGAPGIGLGRLATLDYMDEQTLRDEIAIALQRTISAGFGLNHSLCHGDLGNLETLLVATQKLADSSYAEHLNYFTALILDSIEQDGWLTGIPLGIEAPGLMTGLAGIGYELLRLAEPQQVPSVLLAAPPVKQEL